MKAAINYSKHFLLTVFLILIGMNGFCNPSVNKDAHILSYVVNPKKQSLHFYWKDSNGNIFRSIQNLKNNLARQDKTLVFAMNGGMYDTQNAPQGLFIQNGKLLHNLDTNTGAGNFYLLPNGVFYITKNNTPYITTTQRYKQHPNIQYATQSGPMLVIDGKIHPAFKKGSTNLNIRNGVGILPNNTIIFAMSKTPINFYDFADYFKKQGCKQALYLDGFVSRTYLPSQNWTQTDGNFGVIIAEVR